MRVTVRAKRPRRSRCRLARRLGRGRLARRLLRGEDETHPSFYATHVTSFLDPRRCDAVGLGHLAGASPLATVGDALRREHVDARGAALLSGVTWRHVGVISRADMGRPPKTSTRPSVAMNGRRIARCERASGVAPRDSAA